jgi:hypothetical protein
MIFFWNFVKNTKVNQSILEGLANCYESYEHNTFIDRFDQFKSKKIYFLEGINNEEEMNLYHQSIYPINHNKFMYIFLCLNKS